MNPDTITTNQQGAPLFARLFAILYDGFLIVAISMLYGGLVTWLSALFYGVNTQDYSQTVGGPLFQFGWVFTLLVFYCYFWIRAGQTVGMKAWRLKVISTTNHPLTVFQCIIRFFSGIVFFAAAGIGLWWVLLDKNNDSLHDRASKTRLIQRPKGQ